MKNNMVRTKMPMKTSIKMLLGAGILLSALILAFVISTRVMFDREIKPNLRFAGSQTSGQTSQVLA
jgi:hypothetical protein